MKTTQERNNGMFYTPKLFCDYAHKMISEKFGEDWKENYVVWDCAAGTLNLTRDYYFKELYCSTLFDSELEIGKNYNKEATKFQFDFLNDYFPMPNDLISEGNKVPDGLVQALKENKPFIFFINPPYGKASGKKFVGGIDAGLTTKTLVCKQMKADKLDSSDFIKQFLYRITKIKEAYNLTNVNVCCFTNPSWLLKPQSKNFRKLWFKNFKFENGIMFCASEFADCSSQWGITFNMWTSGEQEEKNNFVHTLVEKNEDNEIVTIGEKTLYNFDGQDVITTREYINEPNKGKKKTERQVVYCEDTKSVSFNKSSVKLYEDYICQVYCAANDIQHNNMSSITNNEQKSGCGCLQLTKSNLLESCVVLTIKKLIATNWTTDTDQYNMNVTIPDTFKYDCLVKALFANYCMSYRLENDRLKNEFFFLSKDEMLTLANENNNNELFTDARTDTDRFDGQDVITTNQYIQAPNKNNAKTEKEIIYCKDIKTLDFDKTIKKVEDDFLAIACRFTNDIQTNNYAYIGNKFGDYPISITKSNLLESCVVLTIKKLITTNWVIDKDQYNMNVTIPDTFKYDCLVKALFANYCMSYRLENDRLKNEFFFLSKDEMLTLANENNNNELFTDARTDTDRFDGQDVITTNQYIQAPNKNNAKTEKEIIYCKDIKTLDFDKTIKKVEDDFLAIACRFTNDIQTNNYAYIGNKFGDYPISITKSNLLESCVVLTIKKLITTNWVIDKDQYNMNVTIPDAFKYDCLSKALFANYCMSYRLENDRLKNEFFWLSKDEMQQLANEYNNNDCYNDVRTDTDRYVYKLIEEHYNELSAEAKATLEAGRELVRKSFKYRQMFNDKEPKYQINNWDCGWYQIKALCKMFCPDDLKTFMGIYKKFDDKLRPQVYELGFLRK